MKITCKERLCMNEYIYLIILHAGVVHKCIEKIRNMYSQQNIIQKYNLFSSLTFEPINIRWISTVSQSY